MPNIILKRFMIFNSSEGQDESREGDKLLYHWTKEALDYKVSLNEQIGDICLCDASVNVSSRLNCDIGHQLSSNTDEENSLSQQQHSPQQQPQPRDHETSPNSSTTNESFRPNEHGKSLVLTFDTTLVIIVEVEPRQSIWMAAHVAPPPPPPPPSPVDGGEKSQVAGNYSTTTPQSSHSFDPSCIPAVAIERVMNNIYARFCFLNGTFQMIADEVISNELDDVHHHQSDDSPESRRRRLRRGCSEKRRALIRDRMRSVCENYFNVVLPEIHLNSIVSNVASLYNYILYLDLNPLTLMKVNSFINHLVCINPNQIRYSIVIFNDQLLWSGLNMYDTRLLYNYMVSVLIRNALQEELSKEVDKVRRIKESMPIYLTDQALSSSSVGIDSSSSSNNSCLEGELSSEDGQLASALERKLTKFYLTVFRSSNNLTLGLVLSEPNLSDLIQKCEQILTSDTRLGVVPLASLAQSVGQNFLKANLHHHHHPQTHLQHQTMATTTSSSASSVSGWRRSSSLSGSGGPSSPRSLIPAEQKYVYMDRLNVSISWPLSMDMQNKENLLLGSIDSSGLEAPPANRKLRLLRYLIELEPELRELKQQTGSLVEEFFGRTLSDSWLTVTNSKYRAIYSVHNVRNSGLTEAQQSAINLKSIFANNRP